MKETFTLTTHFLPAKCKVYIGENWMQQPFFLQSLENYDKTLFITTPPLERLIPTSFSKNVIVVAEGEVIKTRSWKEKIEDELYARGYGRTSCLVAVGGGALLDLVGFVASTYCRGISFISLPTTLLSMTDAALGGKTGINLQSGKNYIGSFHFPDSIFVDIKFLDSLPEKELKNGISEAIKHGLIGDAELFEGIEKDLKPLLKRETQLLQSLIERSLRCKQEFVQKDPFEKNGIRQMLNFGHTIGHAVEALSGYTLSHGEAVGLGMGVEANLAGAMGLLDQKSAERIVHLLEEIYDFSILKNFPADMLVETMKKDKKSRGNEIYFVALDGIGKAKLAKMPLDKVSDALRMH